MQVTIVLDGSKNINTVVQRFINGGKSVRKGEGSR